MVGKVISSTEYAANFKSNPNWRWGKGDAGDSPTDACQRIGRATLPIWRPRTDVKVPAGASVSAMGSCFARRIETVFQEEGFTVLSRPQELPELDQGVYESQLTNRFNTASMLLEFRRILEGPEVLPDDALLIPQKGGTFMDGHHHSVYSGTVEAIIGRRRRFYDDFQSVKQADAIVLTLGLTEAAFDPASGLYRNASPTPREVARKAPIEIHVLDFKQNMDNVEGIYRLIRTHCVRNPKIFLTVSPVPLGGTFQSEDVLVANAASKATLRTVAHEITSAYDDIIYFPSYEIATNVDQKTAWRADMRHVLHPVVQQIVAQFKAAHMGDPQQSAIAAE
ncbi:GSCFA domain-containing protein [Hansschlegelia zhihuaiae]|uniref:GSCFA domain-containing protein n=1 Tax=Hansschlegelia zhihuaiae TaxID=405005 RepID=A0A4Q0MML3_9HYPH|nr:GSCFA domain-containing protein [Hansschlegelia zhihuaiae]RXF74319.1 hypothetical protein EK403_05700 [Hansschlegelia zhihuaiae]